MIAVIFPDCRAAVQARLGQACARIAPFTQYGANPPSHCRNNLRICFAYLSFRPEAEESARERVFDGLEVITSSRPFGASNRIREIQERTVQQEVCQPDDESVVAFLGFHGGSHHKIAVRSVVEPGFDHFHGSSGVGRGAGAEARS